jgi:hypothetical protein
MLIELGQIAACQDSEDVLDIPSLLARPTSICPSILISLNLPMLEMVSQGHKLALFTKLSDSGI